MIYIRDVRLLVLPIVLGALPTALGCSPGSAICAAAAANNISLVITNGEGQSVDLCAPGNRARADVAASGDAGAAGYCDPSDSDTACSTCLKKGCCTELTACGQDDECLCRATGDRLDGCPGNSATTTTFTAMKSCYDAACPQCPRLP